MPPADSSTGAIRRGVRDTQPDPGQALPATRSARSRAPGGSSPGGSASRTPSRPIEDDAPPAGSLATDTHPGSSVRTARRRRWNEQSTTRDAAGEKRFFRVTHPFHPLQGREFSLVDYRHTWGEDRVYFQDEAGRLRRLPAAWTSLAAPDPFVMISAGRALLRLEDLLQLTRLVARLTEEVPSTSDSKGPRRVSSK